MPSSFISLGRGKGLCCSLGALLLPSLCPLRPQGQVGEGLCLTVQPLGWDGAGASPPCSTSSAGGEGKQAAPTPVERLAAEQTGAEQTCRSPNSSVLRKRKIPNIFHFKLELNLEVLWLQGPSFPTLSWSDLQIPLLSWLVKT